MSKPEGGRWELKYLLPVSAREDLFRVAGDNILLGEPFKFTKENIDQYDF